MRRRCVLEMMTFVDHQAIPRRNDSSVLPVSRRAPHRNVRHQQVMIDNNHLRSCSRAPRLEEKAALEVLTLVARAEIRLRRNFIPYFRAWRIRQIAQGSVFGYCCPLRNCLYAAVLIVEKSRADELCLLETETAEIVSPTLEKSKAHRLIFAECFLEKWKVLSDELFLQIDRVGRYNRPLVCQDCPSQCGKQISKRFAHAGARLDEPDPVVVVKSRNGARHVALRRPVLVLLHRRCNRTTGSKVVGNLMGIE